MKTTAAVLLVTALSGCALPSRDEPGTSYQNGINEALRGHTTEPMPPAESKGRCTEVAGYRRSDGAWVKPHMRCR